MISMNMATTWNTPSMSLTPDEIAQRNFILLGILSLKKYSYLSLSKPRNNILTPHRKGTFHTIEISNCVCVCVVECDASSSISILVSRKGHVRQERYSQQTIGKPELAMLQKEVNRVGFLHWYHQHESDH